MDWPALIGDLQRAGLTQKQIAERCGARQSTISDLLNVDGRSPSYDLGVSLIALRDLVVQNGGSLPPADALAEAKA